MKEAVSTMIMKKEDMVEWDVRVSATGMREWYRCVMEGKGLFEKVLVGVVEGSKRHW